MAYLSVTEYLARFGERETTLFTNDDSPLVGAIVTYDSLKVEGAIGDATEEVEGYIATRYTTPLESPPSIVKGWVAALARLKLAEGTGRVNEAIKDAADRATRQLEKLVDRKLNLPIDEGGTAPAALGAGDALSSGDRDQPVFGSLDGFLTPFTGAGGYAPCWRNGR